MALFDSILGGLFGGGGSAASPSAPAGGPQIGQLDKDVATQDSNRLVSDLLPGVTQGMIQPNGPPKDAATPDGSSVPLSYFGQTSPATGVNTAPLSDQKVNRQSAQQPGKLNQLMNVMFGSPLRGALPGAGAAGNSNVNSLMNAIIRGGQ